MSQKPISYVAIVGGFYNLQDQPEAMEEAIQLAEELGLELARAGLGIVIYFSDPLTLEPHVVRGYAKGLEGQSFGGAKPVKVRHSRKQTGEVKFPELDSRPELLDIVPDPNDDWEQSFYKSLVKADEVDAVLSMAGGTTTLIAGQIALSRPIPILAIDKIEGSTQKIRQVLAIKDDNYPTTVSTPAEKVAWLKAQCDKKREQEIKERKEQQALKLMQSLKVRYIWSGSVLACFLFTVLLGVKSKPNPDYYLFTTILAMFFAGASGALARGLWRPSDNSTPLRSFFLGGLAGLLSGVAFLIPQLVNESGLMDIGNEVTKEAKTLFISVLTIALPAGLGFDAIFRKAQAQAEEQELGPPKDS